MRDDFQLYEDVHFVIEEINGRYHWASMGLIFGDAFTSEDGFDFPEEAMADAIAELSGANALDLSLTAEEQALLATQIAQLHTSSVQEIAANVQCLPHRLRERSYFAQLMALEPPIYLQASLFS